jgi:hypothetical protein
MYICREERHLEAKMARREKAKQKSSHMFLNYNILPDCRGSLILTEFKKKEDKHCSARDWERPGLLGGIPRVVVQISALL